MGCAIPLHWSGTSEYSQLPFKYPNGTQHFPPSQICSMVKRGQRSDTLSLRERGREGTFLFCVEGVSPWDVGWENRGIALRSTSDRQMRTRRESSAQRRSRRSLWWNSERRTWQFYTEVHISLREIAWLLPPGPLWLHGRIHTTSYGQICSS